MLLSSKGAVLCLTKALLSAKQKSFSLSNQRAVVCLTKALFLFDQGVALYLPKRCSISNQSAIF